MSRYCPKSEHDAMKLDHARWSALPLVGIQHVEEDEVGPAETQEIRDCASCGNTLTLTVSVTS